MYPQDGGGNKCKDKVKNPQWWGKQFVRLVNAGILAVFYINSFSIEYYKGRKYEWFGIVMFERSPEPCAGMVPSTYESYVEFLDTQGEIQNTMTYIFTITGAGCLIGFFGFLCCAPCILLCTIKFQSCCQAVFMNKTAVIVLKALACLYLWANSVATLFVPVLAIVQSIYDAIYYGDVSDSLSIECQVVRGNCVAMGIMTWALIILNFILQKLGIGEISQKGQDMSEQMNTDIENAVQMFAMPWKSLDILREQVLADMNSQGMGGFGSG